MWKTRRIGFQFFAEPDGSGGSNGSGGSGEGSGEQVTAGKTFTQEQVNALMANEKRSARAATLRELGYEVKDGKYSETITSIKGILDAGKSQQQKDKEAKDQAETALNSEKSKTASLQAKIDVMTAGVKPDYVDDVITMLLPKVTEQKTLTQLLEEYKTKYPTWFGESSGSKGTGGSTNPPRGKDGKAGEFGKRLAQTGKTSAKSSYFKN